MLAINRILSIVILAAAISCDKIEMINDTPISVEALYMQYACGDWNDDMKVLTVSDTTYHFLVGNDVDPLILNGEDELSSWFFLNKTNEFGMTYRMKGYVEKYIRGSCDKQARKFWITKIEKLDGDQFDSPE